ncbi:MAG: diguanylate cyclase [Betaproteobacteria bacterium]|nr:diguanylate cyclase [Betaproteobacteria bacterium]
MQFAAININMLKKSFKNKIIFSTAIILILFTVVINFCLFARVIKLSDSLIFDESLVEEQLRVSAHSLDVYLDAGKKYSRSAALLIARDPNFVKAIKNRDKSELINIFMPVRERFPVVDSFFPAMNFTIYDSKGKVLARIPDTDSGGSILNHSDVQSVLNGEVSTHFESGPFVKVFICTGSPVYDTDGTLLGAISAGVRLDDDSVMRKIKELFGFDVSLFYDNKKIITTLMRNKQRVTDVKLTSTLAKILVEKTEYFDDVNLLGERQKTYYKPLLDSQNKVLAVMALDLSKDLSRDLSEDFIKNSVITGLIGFAISMTLLFFVISLFSRPIIMLSKNANRIAEGDLNVRIDAKGEDEVGQLGKSLGMVQDSLRKLLGYTNEMILEHERGNHNYRFDTGEFPGNYKVLAGNILELAKFGWKDKLTGIPSRRSFDHRLDLEWNRAIREKAPISILLVDLDKFKDYNDTCGYEQGDVALQKIGQVIMESIRGTIDFVARWKDDNSDFIILLPETDSIRAKDAAERIRAKIESTATFSIGGKQIGVTASIGIITRWPSRKNVSVDDFISQADDMLYKVKEAGMNEVVTF